jgi:hypothetical protein
MLSKISIAVDGDNQPVIRIDYRESDDVRDTLVKRFLETFAHRSIFTTCIHVGVHNDAKDSAVIRPIPPSELVIYKPVFDSIVEEWDKSPKPIAAKPKKK